MSTITTSNPVPLEIAQEALGVARSWQSDEMLIERQRGEYIAHVRQYEVLWFVCVRHPRSPGKWARVPLPAGGHNSEIELVVR